MTPDTPLAPGGRIGILGGGQLGRMLALAAARLGLVVHIYSDVPDPPAGAVAAHTVIAGFDDLAALGRFAAGVDVVTYEFENVPVEAAAACAAVARLHPPGEALARTQDRLAEKRFIAGLGIPVAPFAPVDGPDDLAAGLALTGLPAFLKTRRLGYDGKGQARVTNPEEAMAALARLGGRNLILEGEVTFAEEVSVIAVRARSGEIACYDLPRNRHAGGILRRSEVPAGLPAATVQRAREIARRILEALGYVGVIGVEMFHCGPDAREPLMVNEIAPRVHNSGHWTIEACRASQFENHIRAIAGWPLAGTERHSDAVMDNLLGAEADDWLAIARDPSAALHLYGKGEARPGRKMGHVTRLRPRTPDEG